jgi:OOP family OmpA-OmpF porin
MAFALSDPNDAKAIGGQQAYEYEDGVAAARLQAFGVGPLAPVASNPTDEGRATNRRMELVAH